MKRVLLTCIAAGAALSVTAPARGDTVTYTTSHTLNALDVQCARGVTGAACLDMKNPAIESGMTYYSIDSAYGWDVKDFDPAGLRQRPMDGAYAEGRIADILDAAGNVIGVQVQNQESADWKTGPLGGEWVKGLGALKAKAGTEHMVVVEHLMKDPADPAPLQEGLDYNKRMKDDGKYLYFWGNYNQEPTPVYLYLRLPLPDSWKVPGAGYRVTSARLIVDHDITNSPNDQIRPEDFENENATGILPRYSICPTAPPLAPTACAGLPAGTWVSAVASSEGGDEEVIPAGTVLRDAAGAYTNAWYTTLDRDPFGGPNPRYRLKSSKFGQDLPGVEIHQYVVRTPTTTTLDLLSIKDKATGQPLLADSRNWHNYLDETTDIFGNYDPPDGYSMEDCALTPDFDLMFYIKGEVGKPTVVRKVTLTITYEGDSIPPQMPVDLAIADLAVPAAIRKGAATAIRVAVNNLEAGLASGTLMVTGRDRMGKLVGNFSRQVSTPADTTVATFSFDWTAPDYQTTVTWEARITNDNDENQNNNVAKATTVVTRLNAP